MKKIGFFLFFITQLVLVSCDKNEVDEKEDVGSISAPVLLNCSQGVYSDTILLKWSKVENAVNYFIYRSSSNSSPYILIDSVGSSVNQYVNISAWSNPLKNDVHYFYKIKASNNQNQKSDFSNMLEGWSTQKSAKYGSFVMNLKTGMFWDYKWTYSKSKWGGSPNISTGSFRVQLGASKQIGNLTAYEVNIYGSVGEYKPRWKYLAFDTDKHILFGSEGVTLVTIFDGYTGIWLGGGFFCTRSSTTVYKAFAGNVSIGVASGAGYTINRSSSTDDIVCVDGYGCINGSGAEETYSQTEYFHATIGPVGFYQTYSYTDNNTQATYIENVELLACSALNQEGVFITETEPNQYPNSQQLITPDKVVIGDIGPSDEMSSVNGTKLVLGNEVPYAISMHDFYKFVTRKAANNITINWDKDKYPNAKFDVCIFLMEKSLSGWVAKKMNYDESGTNGITYSFMFSTYTIVGANYVISVKSVNNTVRVPYSLIIQEGQI
jgi:hypothetical protein